MKLFGRGKGKQSLRNPNPSADAGGYVFRRSRTLTGTTSAKVTAGAQPRSQLKTARLQAHELHQYKRRIMRILAVVAVCIAGLSYVILNYIGAIPIQYSQPGGSPNSTKYQQSVQQYFVKYPLERFGFSINRSQLGAYMQAVHPELLSVDVDRSWYGGNAEFVLQFRRPLLVWASGGQKFYVDSQGVAFEYDHLGGKHVSVSDQSGISPDASGGSVASNRFINFLGKMVGAINSKDRGAVTEVIIPASTRQVDVKV